MTRSLRPAALLAAAAAVIAGSIVAPAGCYETPAPACAFACARDDSCPDGYACDPQDRICHRQLPGGGLEACEQPFLDAAPLDARIDATPVDAAIDAATDAAIDAP